MCVFCESQYYLIVIIREQCICYHVVCFRPPLCTLFRLNWAKQALGTMRWKLMMKQRPWVGSNQQSSDQKSITLLLDYYVHSFWWSNQLICLYLRGPSEASHLRLHILSCTSKAAQLKLHILSCTSGAVRLKLCIWSCTFEVAHLGLHFSMAAHLRPPIWCYTFWCYTSEVAHLRLQI